jgi:hypothetical protein
VQVCPARRRPPRTASARVVVTSQVQRSCRRLTPCAPAWPLQRNLTLCKDDLVKLEDIYTAECPQTCHGMFEVSWVATGWGGPAGCLAGRAPFGRHLAHNRGHSHCPATPSTTCCCPRFRPCPCPCPATPPSTHRTCPPRVPNSSTASCRSTEGPSPPTHPSPSELRRRRRNTPCTTPLPPVLSPAAPPAPRHGVHTLLCWYTAREASRQRRRVAAAAPLTSPSATRPYRPAQRHLRPTVLPKRGGRLRLPHTGCAGC